MDRIDLHIEVPALKWKEIAGEGNAEPSSAIRERVERARQVQLARYEGEGLHCNSQMTPKLLKQHAVLDAPSQALLQAAMERFGLSARAYDRILKVSRTIADLDGSETIRSSDVAEAIQYRNLDRSVWRN